MPVSYQHLFCTFFILAGMSAGSPYCLAATIEVDGVEITKLSEAVIAAQEADNRPHIINITTDKLPAADGQILITEPMTINGDADGNGVKCDILADVKSIQVMPVGRGDREKGFLEVQCDGRVTINDLQIHPNADASELDSEYVDAIRLLAPPKPSDNGEYSLNRVWISGSDGNNNDAFVPLTTTGDLYNMPGIMKWSGQDNRLARGIIQVDREKPKRKALKQLGSYDSTITDCHAGLGRGPAINIAPNIGKHIIVGGVFGHCGNEGIRVGGETIHLRGTPENRIVVLRTGNEAAIREGSGGSAVAGYYDAKIEVMQHIDAAATGDIEAFAIADTVQVGKRQDCRTISDVAQVFNGAAADSVASVVSWLSPTEAWAQAQADKKDMLLFFYSPSVSQAKELNMLLEAENGAKSFLGGCACARIDVSQADGDAIAKKYQVYKVPTLLLIAPDAKSFKKVVPSGGEAWEQIQVQLSAR